MDNTILQVPLSKKLRAQATKVALDQGFSSLQEAVRVFLKQLSDEATEVSFQPVVKLSKKNEKRYGKIIEDIEKGIGISPIFDDVDEMMAHLHSGGKIKK